MRDEDIFIHKLFRVDIPEHLRKCELFDVDISKLSSVSQQELSECSYSFDTITTILHSGPETETTVIPLSSHYSAVIHLSNIYRIFPPKLPSKTLGEMIEFHLRNLSQIKSFLNMVHYIKATEEQLKQFSTAIQRVDAQEIKRFASSKKIDKAFSLPLHKEPPATETRIQLGKKLDIGELVYFITNRRLLQNINDRHSKINMQESFEVLKNEDNDYVLLADVLLSNGQTATSFQGRGDMQANSNSCVFQVPINKIVPRYILCLKSEILILPPIVPPLTPFLALPADDNERQKNYNWTYYKKNIWMRLPPNLNMYLNAKLKTGCDNFLMQTDHAVYDVNLGMMRMYRRPTGEMSLLRKEALQNKS